MKYVVTMATLILGEIDVTQEPTMKSIFKAW